MEHVREGGELGINTGLRYSAQKQVSQDLVLSWCRRKVMRWLPVALLILVGVKQSHCFLQGQYKFEKAYSGITLRLTHIPC